MWLLGLITVATLINLTQLQQVKDTQEQNCLLDNTAGCQFGRPPQYMIMAPSRIRPSQIYQVFVTILRMEYGQESVFVFVSVIKGNKEYANTALQFDRPSSRIMQLRMPDNAERGQYKLRVEGKLSAQDTGNIWYNETNIDFNTKSASLFLQLSKPIYRQGQMVHFRIIPILPNMMPKYGNMIVYVDDPTGIPVRRWQTLQTNAGGIISEKFQLSDQPNYGKWHVRVDAFGHTYTHPFLVEEFWEPRFDVNVSVPPYVMESKNSVIRGVVLANQTSGRPCIGNASLTAFFRPSEKIWNETRGWEKPYHDYRNSGQRWSGVPIKEPEYKPVTDISVKDYHMYFAYEYRFIPYFEGRIDFKWTHKELQKIAQRGGQYGGSLKDYEFVFFANVTDWYSSLNRTGWAGTVMFDSKIKLSWVGESIRTFKPLSNMKVQVAVSKYDGTPVTSGGTVTLTDNIQDQSLSVFSGSQSQTPVNGIAEFEFNIGVSTKFVQLTAKFDDGDNRLGMNTESITMYLDRYYSPSGSYISVITSTDHPMVNEYMILHVKTSYFVPRIYYQVVAQSNIIIGDELEMTSKQKTFAIAMSREMVPTARVIVYYVRQSEEVVIDVLNFFVNGTRQNEVKLGINRGKDFSRDTIEFNAYADPGSYVVFSGMLLDLYSRGMNDGITENKLIDELMSYDSMSSNTYRQLWRVSDTDFEYKFFNGPDYGIDANTSFTSAGLVVLTDARVPRLFNEEHCRINNDGAFPCFSAQETDCFTAADRCNGEVKCKSDGADEYMCPTKDGIPEHHKGLDRVSRMMRFYDNSSWAWQEIFVKPDGRVDFRVDVPKYPLTWIINGISISRNLGLGIMQRPVRYDASRYMYIQVEHPDHIVRGEQIGVRVTVFNYWYEDDYIEVLVTMHGGHDTEFVTVEDMGIVTSYNPRTHKGDHQTIVFLEPGESKDIYMPIVPDKNLVYGKMTFKVTATCFMEKDSYEGVMHVKADGVTNYYFTPFLIDVIETPSVLIPAFDIPVDEQFVKPEVRVHQYVPQSPQSWVSLFGDVVTPGFFEDYLNAENLLYKPYGSCEMVTFNFAYNRITLRFMKASKQLKEDQLVRSLQEMNIALQRILSYMNQDDGSFMMFRDDPRPSLWLTAFVAKSVDAANFGEWERELFIPKELINKMVLYMCSRQNKSGEFVPEANDIAYDRKMASLESIKKNKVMDSPIALSAYVLIALFDIQSASGDAAACLETARRDGASYLSENIRFVNEPFQRAIATYALSLSQKRAPFFDLWEMRRNDSKHSYFADDVVYRNKIQPLNTIYYMKPRQELWNEGYAVQSTAYAMMAHMNVNTGYKYEREGMMAWLNSMRNSVGGMASTQDTIVALEALFKFTQKDPHRNVFDLKVTSGISSEPDWERSLNIQKSNYVALHETHMPPNKVWGYVTSSAIGTGRAMLQLTTLANVEYPWLIKTPMRYNNDPSLPVIKFFDVVVDNLTFSGRNESVMDMHICCSWVLTERSLTSGLAVLEVDIPTGYMVMNDTLRDYVRSRMVPNLKRAEFYQRKVVFYFSHLDESKTCVHFRGDRWYPVANSTIQHKLKLYDYYEPGMHNTTLYVTKNLFLLNICFACGSYQCPYCPYFNAASVVTTGISCSLFLLALLIMQKLLVRSIVR